METVQPGLHGLDHGYFVTNKAPLKMILRSECSLLNHSVSRGVLSMGTFQKISCELKICATGVKNSRIHENSKIKLKLPIDFKVL